MSNKKLVPKRDEGISNTFINIIIIFGLLIIVSLVAYFTGYFTETNKKTETNTETKTEILVNASTSDTGVKVVESSTESTGKISGSQTSTVSIVSTSKQIIPESMLITSNPTISNPTISNPTTL